MSVIAKLAKTLLPALPADLLQGLLKDVRKLALHQLLDLVVPQLTRFMTKAIDGLVKVFVTRLEPADARRLADGLVDEFQRQFAQLVESLRGYVAAAHAVNVAQKQGQPSDQVDRLRAEREKMRREVRAEIEDVFTVLAGGEPED